MNGGTVGGKQIPLDSNTDIGRSFLLDWLLALKTSIPLLRDDTELSWALFLIIVNILLLSAIVLCVSVILKYTGEEEQKNDQDTENLSSSSSDYIRRKKDEGVGDKGSNDDLELSFEGVQVLLQQKKKKNSRKILDGSIRGAARPGKLLAIMGPSGSGKSTLLEALAGQIPYSSKLKVYGRRYINGEGVSGGSRLPQMAFIPQESNFFPHMTVKETLEFRANLISTTTGQKKRSEKEQNLQRIMKQLNLLHLADTYVGDGRKVRGLSGGERKRLSIAVKMIGDPPAILFLDEPTSGLDSYQAKQVVESLRKLADESSKTVVAVIHQPSQQVFAQFDDVLVLAEGGKQIYFGPTKDIRKYLQDQKGESSPGLEDTGTAEFILECVSKINANGGIEEKESLKRIDALAAKAKKQDIKLPRKVSPEAVAIHYLPKNSSKMKKVNIFRQLHLLLKRSLGETFRGKAAIMIKVVQQVMLGAIYGGIYKLGTNQSSIQDRIGLLSLIAIGSMNMGMAGTIRSFPKEKSIVTREIGKDHLYDTGPYFLAKAISEIPVLGVLSGIFSVLVYGLTGLQPAKFPTFCGLVSLHTIASEAAGLFIGSISKSSDIALALFPPIVVLNIIFDGKNIAEENIPSLLKWLPKFGLIRWGFEGLTVNEFQGLTFDIEKKRFGPPSIKTGEEVLERYGMAETSVLDVAKVQGTMILSFWLISYLGLKLNQQKYMTMKQPPTGKEDKTKEKEE